MILRCAIASCRKRRRPGAFALTALWREPTLHEALAQATSLAAREKDARIKVEEECARLEQMLGKQAEEKESVLAEMERSTAAAVERTKKELEERLQKAHADAAAAKKEARKQQEECREAERERDSAKVTLEAAVTKLEQVTEELGRRIQSETVLGQEVRTMRERLETQEKKAAAALARVQQARDAQEKECADMSKSLAERYVFCNLPL